MQNPRSTLKHTLTYQTFTSAAMLLTKHHLILILMLRLHGDAT